MEAFDLVTLTVRKTFVLHHAQKLMKLVKKRCEFHSMHSARFHFKNGQQLHALA